MLIAAGLTSDIKMVKNKWETFGPWLQRERELAGVSQTEAANATPVHVIQLSRIENGHSGIKPATLESLVNAINKLSTGHKIDLGTAFRKAGFALPDEDIDGLFSGYENLPPERRRLAKIQIRAILDSLVDPDEHTIQNH